MFNDRPNSLLWINDRPLEQLRYANPKLKSMGSSTASTAKILGLLRQRNEISDQLQQLQAEVAIPGLSPIGHTLMWVIIGLLEETGKAPTLTQVMPLVSYGAKPRSFYHHIPKLKKLGLIELKNTGISDALIYPTENASKAFGVAFKHAPYVLNPTATKALSFIRSHVATHGSFPTHAQINAHLNRKHRIATGVLRALQKKKFIDQVNDKWVLVEPDTE